MGFKLFHIIISSLNLTTHLNIIRLMNYNYFRTISDVGMSPPVFPESPSYLPNSMPHKISMENGDTEQLGNKEEGEICVG